MNKKIIIGALLTLAASQSVMAACTDISYAKLNQAVGGATAINDDSGYPLKFWVTFVDETGKVCAVTTNGVAGEKAGNAQWLGSRVISAQKANTANAFSLDNYTISTANLYTPVQPGGSLYGLQHSNPVDASRAYGGSPFQNGTFSDFLKNKRIGGVNVFGGGLALYKDGKKIGAIGVSGDTSCADHIFAWNVRDALEMKPSQGQNSLLSGALTGTGAAVGITTVNFLPTGGDPVAFTGAVEGDEMIISADPKGADYWTAWQHPGCPATAAASATNGVLFNNNAPQQ